MNQTIDMRDVQVPASLEMLTPQFFSHVLREKVLEVQVLDYPLGEGMTGNLARIGLHYGVDNPNLPRTVVAKFSSFYDAVRESVNALGVYEREAAFYAQIAGNMILRTPRCYYAAYDPACGRSLLLLEDVSNFRMIQWSRGGSIADVQQAVQEIAKLHAAWWKRPGIHDIPWLFRTPPGIENVIAGMMDGFLEALQLGSYPGIRRIVDLVNRELKGVIQSLEEPPVTLIHNDYQLDNLAFNGAGASPTVVVMDWGMYAAAKPATDISYLLAGSVAPKDLEPIEMDLLHDYHASLVQMGVEDYTFEQCLEDYRKSILLHFGRFVYAISVVDIVDGSAGKTVNEAAFAKWTPIIQRYMAAINRHFPGA